MDLAVFGANGPTGRQVVRQALAAGHHVTAVTRQPDAYPLRSPHLEVAEADVTDPDGVERVLSGSQAVISTFGVPYSRNEISVYSKGITHITRAMTIHGITRLVCVSSTTVATEEAPGESLFWRKVVNPALRNVIGRALYDDMQRMVDIVRSSSLDWDRAASRAVRRHRAHRRLRGRSTAPARPGHLPRRPRSHPAPGGHHRATLPHHHRSHDQVGSAPPHGVPQRGVR